MSIRSIGAWLYNWITVIGAVAVGGAAMIGPSLDMLSVIDFSAVLPPELALKIVTGIALLKWACVLIGTISMSIRGPGHDRGGSF